MNSNLLAFAGLPLRQDRLLTLAQTLRTLGRLLVFAALWAIVAAMAKQQTTIGAAPSQPAGLAGLFERHRGELARFLVARCGDRGQAEDLMQELWLKVAGATPGPVANGRAYLFRMANNLMLDTLRGRHRAMARDRGWLRNDGAGDLAPEARPDPALAADESLILEQERAVLHRAIADLPPGAARALRLHRFDGLAQGEVAQAMGISRSGVEKHLATAMRHLRGALADCGFFAASASMEEDDGREGKVRAETKP